MSKIVVQIKCDLGVGLQYANTKIRIGSVEDVSISNTSTLTSHPIVTGDMIADHMYRDPITIQMSGIFSTHGDSYSCNTIPNATLSRMQTLFEDIKRNGRLCEITKIDLDVGESTPKFIKRSNMALTSITWTEGIDDMKFNFTFTEVLTARISVANVSQTDSYLPNISDLVASNFIEEIITYDQLTRDIILALYDIGMVTKKFLNDMANDEYSQLLQGLTDGQFQSSSLTGSDLYIYDFVRDVFNQFTLRYFGYYDDYRTSGEKFLTQINRIRSEFAKMNEAVNLYRFSNDGEQIAYGDISGVYYKFKFEKFIVPAQTFNIFKSTINIPEHYSYSMKVYDISDKLIAQHSNISTAPYEFIEATHSLFTTSNGRKVYLLFRKPTVYSSYFHTQIEYARANTLLSSDNDARVDWCWLASSTIKPNTLNEKIRDLLLNLARA